MRFEVKGLDKKEKLNICQKIWEKAMEYIIKRKRIPYLEGYCLRKWRTRLKPTEVIS